ncbi:transporter substrate-binding domain-containing protein [Paucibacter sp. APW11]|uniref:Transporter substrate-binding domain-containing protein n=1 Tax=Roseateles aquae TaxID=3077235 RepID=A0ABU3PHI1_9BURK|nr:transporter substrate-binding domain-containing protein [Paucibacter sp. APW11]MDT9002040.1 transporter substrate-binding domain-containing protein [Paucibacter sp. APW11]
MNRQLPLAQRWRCVAGGQVLRLGRCVTFLSVALLMLAGLAQAEERSRVLHLCVDELPLYPWRSNEGHGLAPRGLDFLLIETAAQRLGLRLEIAAQPWKRCQIDLQRGQQDAALGMSFRAERLELGVFPMQDSEAQPDDALRMRRERYSFYKRSDQGLSWDGHRLIGAEGQPLRDLVVGAQAGYSVVEQLRSLGLKVDDGTRSAEANLEKLLRGRVQAVALLAGEGDDLIKRDPRWSQSISRLDPPLVEKSYYLVFSRAFFAAQPQLARQLWAELARVRESADYRRAEAELLRR